MLPVQPVELASDVHAPAAAAPAVAAAVLRCQLRVLRVLHDGALCGTLLLGHASLLHLAAAAPAAAHGQPPGPHGLALAVAANINTHTQDTNQQQHMTCQSSCRHH